MSSPSDQTGVLCQNPLLVLLFSGKRKCGKDFVTDLLYQRIGENNTIIIKISAPIKSHWAEINGLNLEQLMSASQYKERHREGMIKWSEALRDQDSGYFCRKAISLQTDAVKKPIWIVSDVRRRTDIAWFCQEYGKAVRTVRVIADDEIRVKRGFIFTPGIDDKATECDLDEVSDWHWVVHNNGKEEELEESMMPILNDVQNELKGGV